MSWKRLSCRVLLDDQQIALAVINTTYASQIGLTPAKDGLFVEDKDSPYVNLLVAREDNKDAGKREEIRTGLSV